MKTFPIIEIFGPTIQGEGALAGLPTLFVRFGGCDYRCSWCDSMYAVDPVQVRENAEKITASEIVSRCLQLSSARGLHVTLSGGNPALMQFTRDGSPDDLVTALHHSLFRVSVETQGSIWRDWLLDVDQLVVSPKPPSSGMATGRNANRTAVFMHRAETGMPFPRRSLKIVVFDDDDLAYAKEYVAAYSGRWMTYLSVGTSQDNLQDEYALHAGIAERYGWLCDKVASDPVFVKTKVIPQLHVIAFGAKRGV